MESSWGIAIALAAALGVPGVIGAVIGSYLTRRKNRAEVVRIEVESDKVEVETSSEAVRIAGEVMGTLRTELSRVNESLELTQGLLAKSQQANEELRTHNAALIRQISELRSRIAQLEAYMDAHGLGPLPPAGLEG